MLDDYPFIRQLESPLTAHQLRPLDPRCEVVQFRRPLKEDEFKRLADFMRAYPQVALRAFEFTPMGCDLEFLRHFGFLRRFQVDVYGLRSFAGLEYLSPDLEYLGLGWTKIRSFSLKVLERFPNLRSLYLEQHSKDIDALGSLSALQELTLRSVTIPDLSVLTPLRQLRWLGIKLGGIKDLRLLPKIGRLGYLEVWMVRGLTDLSVIADVPTLEYVYLQALKRVTELPSLRSLPLLRRLALDTMKGLQDLQPAAEAPNLEELEVFDMPQLQPEALRPFVGHAALKRATVALGSLRKNQAVKELLQLPRVEKSKREFDFRESVGPSLP